MSDCLSLRSRQQIGEQVVTRLPGLFSGRSVACAAGHDLLRLLRIRAAAPLGSSIGELASTASCPASYSSTGLAAIPSPRK